ncbi:MAG: SDR family oxidoreductase [Deltaproteobacteria bacterium]|nr:SDR family oxidoreductase [Deltaproteobacteria bacterium]
MTEQRRWAVVTGASTGIGRATTKALVEHGLGVFGSVRKQADADSLSDEFGDQVVPLSFDVTDPEAIAEAVKAVHEVVGDQPLAGLVNNAGVAMAGPLMHIPMEELRQQFEVNVFGLMAVTQAFLPALGARRGSKGVPGRVVNVSSVAGRITAPFLGAYAASKHAVEALSDALRRELLIYGIDVIVIQPGAIKTPIWDKAEALDLADADDTDYATILPGFQKMMLHQGRNGLEASRVGNTVVQALTTASPRTRYPIPDQPWVGWRIPRLMPDRWVDRAIAKQVGLRPPTDS